MATEVAIAAEADALVHQIRVAVPEGGYRHDLRAVSFVWRRELIRFRTDRLCAITALIQPILFLSCSVPACPRWPAAACRRE